MLLVGLLVFAPMYRRLNGGGGIKTISKCPWVRQLSTLRASRTQEYLGYQSQLEAHLLWTSILSRRSDAPSQCNSSGLMSRYQPRPWFQQTLVCFFSGKFN
jgi:hypothetical protein